MDLFFLLVGIIRKLKETVTLGFTEIFQARSAVSYFRFKERWLVPDQGKIESFTYQNL